MGKNKEEFWNSKLIRLADKLRSNQMDAYIAQNSDELYDVLDSLIVPGSSVCNGGSMTLVETGVLDYLREKDVVFFDRDQAKSKGTGAVQDVYRHSFSVDYYLTSSNAITGEGWLYNVDATGNRVAAMIFGPRNVIVVCGRNKLVDTVEDAENRVRNYTAPVNCMRLSKKTPCASTGLCSDCSSTDRICNVYTLIKRISQKGRIKVILLNYEAGY